jgi:hypothetical protein
MAHYAELDENSVVTQVFVGRDESDLHEGVEDWEVYYARPGFTVKRTSYNTRGGVHYNAETGEPGADQSKAFRKNYAGIDFTYDEERDAFIPPKPHNSWVLNEDTCLWQSPIPYPEDGDPYYWDEAAGDWVNFN